MIAIFSTVCIISDRPGSGVEDETGYPLVQWVCWPVVKTSKGEFNWFMHLRVDPFTNISNHQNPWEA